MCGYTLRQMAYGEPVARKASAPILRTSYTCTSMLVVLCFTLYRLQEKVCVAALQTVWESGGRWPRNTTSFFTIVLTPRSIPQTRQHDRKAMLMSTISPMTDYFTLVRTVQPSRSYPRGICTVKDHPSMQLRDRTHVLNLHYLAEDGSSPRPRLV